MADEPFQPEALPPEPETHHTFTRWEKVRIASGMTVLSIGQIAVTSNLLDNFAFPETVFRTVEIDAAALTIGLGLALSVPEVRRRLARRLTRLSARVRGFFATESE